MYAMLILMTIGAGVTKPDTSFLTETVCAYELDNLDQKGRWEITFYKDGTYYEHRELRAKATMKETVPGMRKGIQFGRWKFADKGLTMTEFSPQRVVWYIKLKSHPKNQKDKVKGSYNKVGDPYRDTITFYRLESKPILRKLPLKK
jgi:hypothetical protein